MASSRLLLLLLISALAIALTEAGSKDLILGKREPNDRLISVDFVKKDSKWLQIVKETKTFPGDNRSVFTQVKLLDQNNKGNGATATVVAGGPGFNYITVKFTSQRSHSINYVVEVYGY